MVEHWELQTSPRNQPLEFWDASQTGRVVTCCPLALVVTCCPLAWVVTCCPLSLVVTCCSPELQTSPHNQPLEFWDASQTCRCAFRASLGCFMAAMPIFSRQCRQLLSTSRLHSNCRPLQQLTRHLSTLVHQTRHRNFQCHCTNPPSRCTCHCRIDDGPRS